MKRLYKLFATALLVLALPAFASAQEISPMSVAGATTVDTAKAKALFDKKVVFIDSRSGKDWDAGRIPGAEHIDIKGADWNEANVVKAAGGKDKEVVMYCNGEKCLRSSQAAAEALKWGFTKVYYYRDGFPSWQAAGYPVE